MQLMRLADVTATDRDRIFAHSRSRALLGAMFLLITAVAAAVLSWINHSWLGYYLAAVIFLSFFIFRKMVSARFRPSNWLVRLTDQGLFIKLRSYLNDHFPEQDFTVVFIAHSEIRSARFVLQKQEVPDRDDGGQPTTMTKTQKLVEVELVSETKELADALARERTHAIDGKNLGMTSTRFHHLPVRLAAPDRLHIEWNVAPNAQTFLDALSRHTLIQPTQKTKKDYVHLETLSRAEQEARLLELAESGDKIGAIAMARRLYAYDLATAKDFIEGLASKPTTGRELR
jgi:hypothetical protein